MYKTLLLSIDSSPSAKKVLQTALDMAQLCGSKVVVLSVVETQEQSDPAHPEQTSTEAVAALLSKSKTVFEQRGFAAETIEREGNPAFIICDVADDVSADLIVMGCRGTGLIEDGCEESVSNRVINLAPCPVLVVP
ncbi:universal stress protein [cf. Phormidesmis sp. LEGE 11477]|uniref:universal stress protein n=1 Tax=cf. Phormidesmis sp. LEGE 11477 TaxID=1828680 RepID=UPI00187E11C8|nr:universal stress protein [cf. Phormidesmis sp. LEGE 11477]MBE9060067.1 universal stress protein [cf. Phormidesmis sp. LEGE 11477]